MHSRCILAVLLVLLLAGAVAGRSAEITCRVLEPSIDELELRLQRVRDEIRRRKAMRLRVLRVLNNATIDPTEPPPDESLVEWGRRPSDFFELSEAERVAQVERELNEMSRVRAMRSILAGEHRKWQFVARNISAVELVTHLAQRTRSLMRIRSANFAVRVSLICPVDLSTTQFQTGVIELLRLRGLGLTANSTDALQLDDIDDPSTTFSSELARLSLAKRLASSGARMDSRTLVTLGWSDYHAVGVVELMGLLCERAIVFDDGVPNVAFSLEDTTLSRSEAVAMIDAALCAQGIILYEVGDAFIGACCKPPVPAP